MTGNTQLIMIWGLYLLFFQITSTNTRTSTLWKLNSEETKIIEGGTFHPIISLPNTGNKAQFIVEDDPMFNIITSTLHYGQSWVKEDSEYYCTNCHTIQTKNAFDKNKTNSTSHSNTAINNTANDFSLEEDDALDCGKPVNFTYYDTLVGVINRNQHPIVPEPQISLIFSSRHKKGLKGLQTYEFDVDALERRLRKAKKDKPKSVQLYNQIGNFWRIKGDARQAIECFRRALAVAPHNSDVLLNLGRVLFTLQYLDDAIYLTRRSLEMQPHEKEAWQQYFTLGEIFKAYGHYQEASLHLKHTLELRPGFEPAHVALKEMENMPATTIHIYTLVIIICLVLGVLLVILSSVELNEEGEAVEGKPQRHFNRAMAMSTLRGMRMSQKHTRPKKMTA